MSRVGKKPILIPEGVTVKITDGLIVVKGSKGELQKQIHRDILVDIREREINLKTRTNTKKNSALWGLFRTLIANMILGVVSGFEKKLEFEGVGYRAVVEGDVLVMQLGFSHPVRFKSPTGINFKVEKNTITIAGFDKELVGDTAAQVRNLKPVEPYKGKGIRYKGEIVRRKAGKKAVASA